MDDDKALEVKGFDALISALQIFSKYGNPEYPTMCEHDVMYIAGIDPKMVTEEDIKKLDGLGFFVNEDNCFESFHFGSA